MLLCVVLVWPSFELQLNWHNCDQVRNAIKSKVLNRHLVFGEERHYIFFKVFTRLILITTWVCAHVIARN